MRNPALLAVLAAICLQRPSAGIPMPPAQALLAIADGFGLFALAFLELRIRLGRG